MVKSIFKKEMIDILRDKKTLFMGIILPLILYPVLMLIMTQIMSMSMNSIESEDINIAFEKNPNKELISIIENYSDESDGHINIVHTNNYKKDIDIIKNTISNDDFQLAARNLDGKLSNEDIEIIKKEMEDD